MNTKKKRTPRKTPSHLTEDTFNYYKRIEGVLKDSGITDEQKGEIVNNMFSQLLEEAIHVCQCPQTSSIIEGVISYASCTNIRGLIDAFSQDWAQSCSDRCSSHVVQKMVSVIPKFIRDKLKDFSVEKPSDSSDEAHLILTILRLSEYFLENLEESLNHQHVSHILRALFQVLAGTCVKDTEHVQKSKSSRNYGKKFREKDEKPVEEITFENYEIPQEFRSQLKRFYKGIFKLENFGIYLTDSTANPVVQTLLIVLHKADIDLCQRAVHKVISKSRIKDSSEHSNLPPVVADSVGSFLIQQVVSLCSEELFTELFQKLFKGRILQFSTHPCANFVLQKLIRACNSKDIFRELVDELIESMDEVWEAQYFGVLVAMSETAEKLSCKQDQIVQAIMKSLQCFEPVERQVKFAVLLGACQPYDTFYGRRPEDTESRPRLTTMNYHGSLLLQHLLQFTSTKLLEASFLDLEPADVMSWSCDPKGSHVIEAFFKSSTVKLKGKEGLLNKLNGLFVQLACNKNGSRTLEAIWRNMEVKHRSQIAADLCKQEAKVKSDMFGRHIHRNFALFHFSKRLSEWTSLQKNEHKKRQMFKDVLDSDGPPLGKKRKKNKKERN